MAAAVPTAVDEAAEHLYGVPLVEFVAERKAAAAASRAAGDRGAAARIAALPKASTAAWVVDLLVREEPDVVDSLTQLGESLRDAQDDLDPAALRSLGDQRRRLVAQIAAQAVDLAVQHGQSVGLSVREEVERTLQAALADEGAATAVRTGRLVRALETNGFDAVDVEGAVAGGGSAAALRSWGFAASAAVARGRRGDGDDLAAARRRKAEIEERRRAADEARSAVDAVRQRARRADAARHEADESRDHLREERDELRRRLDDAEEALAAASTALRSATSDADDAQDALAAAEDAADRAASRLSALEKRYP